jgi:hypothetical protein
VWVAKVSPVFWMFHTGIQPDQQRPAGNLF